MRVTRKENEQEDIVEVVKESNGVEYNLSTLYENETLSWKINRWDSPQV